MGNSALDGVKMLHHEEMRNFDRIQSKIFSVILSHGCKIVETPSFEDYDVYQNHFPQLRRQMVKTIDTDGRILVLRPDVTLPLVEAAAREFPRADQLLKFGYVSTVFREYFGRSTSGKDFLQGGIEILGDSSPECDGEIVAMAVEILRAVGVKNFRIDVGTAAYTGALFDGLPLEDDQKEELRTFITERNLVALGRYAATLPLEGRDREALAAIPVLFGPYEPTLARAREFAVNDGMKNALTRLEKVYRYIQGANLAGDLCLDFGFTSRLGYYTDTVFKIYIDGALYEVGGGGRYDTLSSRFGVDRPACGFGMNINLLYEYMSDAGLLEDAEPSFQLAVSYVESDPKIVADLVAWRAAGFRVAAHPVSSFVDGKDCRLRAEYRDGKYFIDGLEVTARELEEKMRGK